MQNNPFGIVLTTHEQNPLQAMLLAPFTVFENGQTILRKRADQNINMHMFVAISDDIQSLPKIKPVIYRFDGTFNGDFHHRGLVIESHWYNTEYDRFRGSEIW